jgi:hypothetical protein
MNLRSAEQFSPKLLIDVTDWDLAGYASGIVARCDLNLVETSIVTRLTLITPVHGVDD